MHTFSLLITTSLLAGNAAAGQIPRHVDPARQSAPADGWAGQKGGTQGGSGALDANVFIVTSRSELLNAIASNGASKIIKVGALIDMSDGKPYASSADQAERGTVRLTSNTTLIGMGENAGFINGQIKLVGVSQVIVRNLRMRNPCDVAPLWDPADSGGGNWNALFDSIGISNSQHVWVDHNSFTDAPYTDENIAIVNGKRKQCHDGAVDVIRQSDFVTVSYNHFSLHEKNMLIGSSDRADADEGRLNVTISNNLFDSIVARNPRVRFGHVHLLNNYYAGNRKAPVYAHDYSIGVGKRAHIISTNNAFEIAGALRCDEVVSNPGSSAPGGFSDAGSLLNGHALGACSLAAEADWSVPYSYLARPAAQVKAWVLANAGAGKLP
ncbi:MAG: hypothetical protein ABIT83_17835 [Massilia sp.]